MDESHLTDWQLMREDMPHEWPHLLTQLAEARRDVVRLRRELIQTQGALDVVELAARGPVAQNFGQPYPLTHCQKCGAFMTHDHECARGPSAGGDDPYDVLGELLEKKPLNTRRAPRG